MGVLKNSSIELAERSFSSGRAELVRSGELHISKKNGSISDLGKSNIILGLWSGQLLYGSPMITE